jgi:DNA-binding response OmpR family regulator
MDGFEMAKRVRESDVEVPIVFLTARSLKIDKLKGFNLGADDYITKPVEEEELLARIQAILRRVSKARPQGQGVEHGLIHFGDCTFDTSKRILHAPAGRFNMTDIECRLLEMLMSKENQLLPRTDALKHIWGSNDYFTRKSMDVHIHKLRNMLKSSERISIVNIHGKGFVLNVDA